MRAAALLMSTCACFVLACGGRALNVRDGGAGADARPGDAPPEVPVLPPDGTGGDGDEVACPLEATSDAAPATAAAPCDGTRLLDPDLQGSAWRATGGARFSCGAAILDGESMCAQGGITQALPAQDSTCDLPLVLNLKGTSFCDNGCWLDVAVGQAWNQVSLGFLSGTYPLCLGAAAQAGGVRLFLGGAPVQGGCPVPDEGSIPGTITFDRVSIDVDTKGICPPLGAVADGDFEGPTTGWTIDTDGEAIVVIEPGIGEGASKGARLKTISCLGPKISAPASIPTAAMMPSPALQLWSQSDALVDGTVSIAGTVTSLSGSAEPETMNVCMPRWAQGTVQTLTMGLNSHSQGQGCNVQRQATFDNARFVTDPSCAPNANLFNPGFEEAMPTSGAFRAWQLYGAQVRRDGSLAHSGAGALVLRPYSDSGSLSGGDVTQGVTVPAPAGSAGPALSLWVKAMDDGPSSPASGSVRLADALPTLVSLSPTNAWRQVKACLDPRRAGRPDTLRIYGQSMAIDDVELTTDPACPAQ